MNRATKTNRFYSSHAKPWLVASTSRQFHTTNVTVECCLPVGTVVGSHKHLARGRVGEPQLLTHRPQKNSLVVLVGVARVLCDHHSRELELG